MATSPVARRAGGLPVRRVSCGVCRLHQRNAPPHTGPGHVLTALGGAGTPGLCPLVQLGGRTGRTSSSGCPPAEWPIAVRGRGPHARAGTHSRTHRVDGHRDALRGLAAQLRHALGSVRRRRASTGGAPAPAVPRRVLPAAPELARRVAQDPARSVERPRSVPSGYLTPRTTVSACR